jgi:aminoglycoside 2'-N-acetyltransferase I
MRVELGGGDETWAIAEPLSELVYPPEIMATIVWRDVTWAHADERVLVYDEERLVSHAGLYLRQALHDGSAMRIGGIGGVMTHPAYRARGFASAALRRAEQSFRAHGVDFALLFCEPKNFAFYGGLGWRVFPGEVIVEQPDGQGPFTIMAAMVRDMSKPAPSRGKIDLCGLPW